MLFGALLIFTAAAELTGFGRRLRFEGPLASVAGAASGVLGGLVFPLAAAVALREQASTERVAGAVDAADHIGACAGALVTGVVLVPVLGISGTCLVVATMKVLSSLFVGAAATTPLASSPAPSA